jgi:GTP cyclohydrolase II
VAEASLTTRHYGIFQLVVFADADKEHIALTLGDVSSSTNVPVRLQSECLPGTALDSADCECADQLTRSFEIVSEAGIGVILYMREEGRGLGLTTKVKALANKNRGMDTFQAVRALGLQPDLRNHASAAAILNDFGILSVRPITNNPEKIAALRNAGINVGERIAVEITATTATSRHLAAKLRAGHFITQNLHADK